MMNGDSSKAAFSSTFQKWDSRTWPVFTRCSLFSGRSCQLVSSFDNLRYDFTISANRIDYTASVAISFPANRITFKFASLSAFTVPTRNRIHTSTWYIRYVVFYSIFSFFFSLPLFSYANQVSRKRIVAVV